MNCRTKKQVVYNTNESEEQHRNIYYELNRKDAENKDMEMRRFNQCYLSFDDERVWLRRHSAGIDYLYFVATRSKTEPLCDKYPVRETGISLRAINYQHGPHIYALARDGQLFFAGLVFRLLYDGYGVGVNHFDLEHAARSCKRLVAHC
jgi:hypothetical protein